MATSISLPKGVPLQYRHLEIRREWIDEKARTVEFSFSSTTPVERWYAFEILSHEPGAIDFDRILKGGALLENHDWGSHIGVIEKAWVENNERGWVRARFSKNPHPEEVWRDVLDGIKRNVSVGYVLGEWEVREPEPGEEQTEPPTVIVTQWEPHEISLVSVPADYSVGLGRDQDDSGKLYAVRLKTAGAQSSKDRKRPSRPMATRAQNNDPAPVNGNGDPPALEINVEVVREQTRRDESKRVREILAMANRFNCQSEAQEYIEQNRPLADFMHFVLTERCNAQPIIRPTEVGLSNREIRNYSILKALRELSDINGGPRLTGLELEASNAMAKILKKQPEGFFIPREVMYGPMTRDLAVTTPPSPPGPGGGNLVATELVLPIIDYLRNALVVRSAGARVLAGLQGNIAIPKQTGTATAQWRTEVQPVTPSDQAFAQIALIPKRLSTMTVYSRQLVIQSSLDIEALIRSDLAAVMATEIDRAALFGSGTAPEPRGILNQVGINRWTFGTDPLFEGYVRGVVALEDAKVPLTSPAWVVNPRCWGAGISTPKFPNTGITVVSDNDTCLGYPYLRTQQIPNTGATSGLVFFGSWDQLLIGAWDGTDLVVDPYSLAQNAQIRIVIHEWADVNVRYPEAFAVSTDSGYGDITFPFTADERTANNKGTEPLPPPKAK
jgi:HK97 family phage major capsid protein